MNEIALNKKISIERCIHQIQSYYAIDTGQVFEDDHLKQDAIAMNLQRACELAIDLANFAIKTKKLGLPQSSRDSFELLASGGLISRNLSNKMQAMVGFRNILVHEYRKLNVEIMINVIQYELSGLLTFADKILKTLD